MAARAVRAIRGAIQVEHNDRDEILQGTAELVAAVMERNHVVADDLISIVFTATDDIHSIFPATAARKFGLGDVPLICARELEIDGATPRCIRVLVHLMTERSRRELHHVYLEGAKGLRDDLPE